MRSSCQELNMASSELLAAKVVQDKIFLDEVERETIAAYDILAPEYDSSVHETTRKLEHLSLKTFHDLIIGTSILSNSRRVLEVGCGTGALSGLLIRLGHNCEEFVLLDSSARMLKLAHARLTKWNVKAPIRYVRQSILSNRVTSVTGAFDLVVCGLGDPYFIGEALLNIREYCHEWTYLAVTLPEHTWATLERTHRLNVPIDRTCFRLSSGETVYPYSFTYGEDDLRNLLEQYDFQVLGVWSRSPSLEEISVQHDPSKPPSISYIVARAI